MKTNLHPSYHHQATVECACGHSFATGSTLKKIKADICSQCHPFFTGEMKFVDTLGNVDKFLKKQAAAKKYQGKKKKEKRNQKEYKSLKEMLTVTKIDQSLPSVKK